MKKTDFKPLTGLKSVFTPSIVWHTLKGIGSLWIRLISLMLFYPGRFSRRKPAPLLGRGAAVLFKPGLSSETGASTAALSVIASLAWERCSPLLLQQFFLRVLDK